MASEHKWNGARVLSVWRAARVCKFRCRLRRPGGMHIWRLLNFWDFGPSPSPFSVPNSRNLAFFGQKLANPLPPPLFWRHLCMAPCPHAALTMSPLGCIIFPPPTDQRFAHSRTRKLSPCNSGKLPNDFNHVILMSNLTVRAFWHDWSSSPWCWLEFH